MMCSGTINSFQNITKRGEIYDKRDLPRDLKTWKEVPRLYGSYEMIKRYWGRKIEKIVCSDKPLVGKKIFFFKRIYARAYILRIFKKKTSSDYLATVRVLIYICTFFSFKRISCSFFFFVFSNFIYNYISIYAICQKPLWLY